MPSLPLRARLEGAMARLILGLPAPLVRLLAGRPVEIDGHVLDAQAQLTLALERLVDGVPMAESTVERARALVEKNAMALAPEAPPLDRVEELLIPGPAGALAARLYRPLGLTGDAAPALIFFHGGGFVVGSLDSHDTLCRVFAARARCVVISVAYRLAPEHPFPAGVEDAVAAFRHVAAEAQRLGLDAARLAVGGDSAGGEFAAVICLATRGDTVRPSFQLLLYPVVDATSSFPSVITFAEGYFLDRETIDWYLARYLPPGTDPRDWRASPLFAPDLSGVPPALIASAGFDPLRDEAAAYADKLRAAGVAVDHRCYGGLFHGFLSVSGAVDAAAVALDEICSALGKALASVR